MEVRPLIFYKTTADFDNTGEVLIYRTLLENLREYGNVIVDDSPHIQSLFLKRIGLRDEERLHRYTKKSFTKYIIVTAIKNFFIRRPIFFVTGIGDHVVKSTKDVLKNFFSFLFILFIRIGGIKVLRIGMSIRFDGRMPELSEKLLAIVIPNYFVRDSLSLYACKKNGINARLAPDLSWAYHVDGFEMSNQGKNLIILSFRDYVRKGQEEPYKSNLYQAIEVIVKYLCKNNSNQLLLTYQSDYDKYVCLELQQYLASICHIQIADELITLHNANKYYGKSSIIISNRLHVLLLGYKYGALTIGLTDIKEHLKIMGIFSDEGLRNHIIDICQSPNDLISQFVLLSSNIEEEWEKIHKVEMENHAKLKFIFRNLFVK